MTWHQTLSLRPLIYYFIDWWYVNDYYINGCKRGFKLMTNKFLKYTFASILHREIQNYFKYEKFLTELSRIHIDDQHKYWNVDPVKSLLRGFLVKSSELFSCKMSCCENKKRSQLQLVELLVTKVHTILSFSLFVFFICF